MANEENDTKVFNRISEAKRAIGYAFDPEMNFPVLIYFKDDSNFTTYKITIELQEDACFIDSKGRKWILEKE